MTRTCGQCGNVAYFPLTPVNGVGHCDSCYVAYLAALPAVPVTCAECDTTFMSTDSGDALCVVCLRSYEDADAYNQQCEAAAERRNETILYDGPWSPYDAFNADQYGMRFA